ncbi:MAG TPA: phospholipase D-like domain-containing protein [Gammaproteobacteria bacterium]
MLETLSGAVPVPYWLLALHLLITLVLIAVVWSLKHRRDPHYRIESDAPIAEMMPSIVGLTHGQIVPGNAVDFVENGAFFDALLRDIAAAERSIHFETFLWKAGEIERRLVEALAARSRAGVRVRVLVDANGGKGMSEEAERVLRTSGCTVARYHPGGLRSLGRLNSRDHRKLAVLDGRLAYVGGHCVVDSWLGDAEDAEHFRDISARLRGPVVHALQSAFSETWVVTTGELFAGEDVFPTLEPEGDTPVHVARLRLSGTASSVKILHHLAICCAQERITIQNPYFLPDSDGIDLLAHAVQRGVQVRVMTPSSGASDLAIVQHAAHSNYAKLLSAGVRLYEYRKTLLHQKVMVVDGRWCAFGSSNFDDRSFEINEEIVLGFDDPRIAERLEQIFERDAKDCVELTTDSWSRRSIGHRLLDGTSYLLKEQL